MLLGFVFLFDVFFAGVAQAALPFLFSAATALLGVLLAVCKIVVSHHSFIMIMPLSGQYKHFNNVVIHIVYQAISLSDTP